jgi:hypothetical protein
MPRTLTDTITDHPDAIVVRLATPADAAAIERLAALDSAPAPRFPLLIGESGGHVLAALPLGGGPAIADPFALTAGLLELLRMRAGQLRQEQLAA